MQFTSTEGSIVNAHTPERARDEIDRLEAAAYAAGRDHGIAAASWYFDGNTTTQTYAQVLCQLREGDPAVYDTFPTSPLSGEWADDPTPRTVLADLDVSEDDDAADWLCAMYEDGFGVAVSQEIERLAIAALDLQTCRDCGRTFSHDPDADRCPACVSAMIEAPIVQMPALVESPRSTLDAERERELLARGDCPALEGLTCHCEPERETTDDNSDATTEGSV